MNTPQGPQPYRPPPPPYGRPPGPPPPRRPQYPPPPGPGQYRPPPPPPHRPLPPPAHHGPPAPPQYGQSPTPRPQYAQPQPQYGPPAEGIAVTTSFFPLAWLFFFIKPKIFLDGQEQPPANWGRSVLPARPGQHHVHVYTPYFLPSRVGPADATAHVTPGQVVELEYKAPLWSFSPGSLGVGPQKYNGVGITVAIVAIPFVIVALLILFSVFIAAI